MDEIWITGIGIVSPLGIGCEAVEASLREHRSGIRPITLFETEGYPVKCGGEVSEFRARDLVRNRKALKISRRNIHLALAAGNLAWEHAGLEGRVAPERAGVVMSAGRLGATLEEICPALREAINGEGRVDLAKYAETSARIMPPYWFLRHIPNLVPGTVAIDLGLKAPSNTICVGGIGSLLALDEAVSILRRGDSDVMLAGGADCLVDAYHVVTHHQLGRLDVEHPEGPRPFHRDAAGTVLGETGTVVVLERADFARAGNRAPLAVWEGFRSGRPSEADPSGWVEEMNGTDAPAAAVLGGTGRPDLDSREISLAYPNSKLACYRNRSGWLGSSTGVHDLACALIEARATGAIANRPHDGVLPSHDRWENAAVTVGDTLAVQTLSWTGAFASATIRIA